MIQSSPCIESHFSFGVTHNFETLGGLIHERNQITIQSRIAAAQRKHLEASTRNLYLQSGQAFSSRLKTFILEKVVCLNVTGIVRRLGESFHLSLRLLSLHLQTLLEHLLLVHQLLTKPLE